MDHVEQEFAEIASVFTTIELAVIFNPKYKNRTVRNTCKRLIGRYGKRLNQYVSVLSRSMFSYDLFEKDRLEIEKRICNNDMTYSEYMMMGAMVADGKAKFDEEDSAPTCQ